MFSELCHAQLHNCRRIPQDEFQEFSLWEVWFGSCNLTSSLDVSRVLSSLNQILKLTTKKFSISVITLTLSTILELKIFTIRLYTFLCESTNNEQYRFSAFINKTFFWLISYYKSALNSLVFNIFILYYKLNELKMFREPGYLFFKLMLTHTTFDLK